MCETEDVELNVKDNEIVAEVQDKIFRYRLDAFAWDE
jgi:stalled ribosome alternative rescue factor ArfA